MLQATDVIMDIVESIISIIVGRNFVKDRTNIDIIAYSITLVSFSDKISIAVDAL